MGEQGGSCAWAGAGGARWAREGRRSLGAGVRWLDGRKRAGPTLHVCRATTRARGVGGALTFRLDLTLLARRQREDGVDPEGLDVRGRGECPDPAARYTARTWAHMAGAPSPAPASSCTAIVSFSRGQAIYGYLTRRLTAPGGTKNTSGKRASLAEARPIRPVIDQNSRSMLLCACTAARHLPARGEKALNFRCKKLQKTLRRRGEGNAAGSYLMRTAARAFREPAGLRSWAALGLQRVLLELPFVGLGQQAGHLGAACWSGSTS